MRFASIITFGNRQSQNLVSCLSRFITDEKKFREKRRREEKPEKK